MTHNKDFSNLERKLDAFFDGERELLKAPSDLFSRIQARLPAQDRPRWWTRFNVGGRPGLKIAMAGLATVLVAAVSVATWQLGMDFGIAGESRVALSPGEPGKPDEPGARVQAGASGAPGAFGVPAPAATSGPAAAAATPAGAVLTTAGGAVIQTVVVERAASGAPTRTSTPAPVASFAGATATPAPASGGTVTRKEAEALVWLALSPSGVGITEHQFETLVRQAMAGELALDGADLPDGFQDTYFENYGVNPFVSAAEEPFSTFAMDVDTASYTIARAWLNQGQVPPVDAIRVEEFVNFFDQDYPDATGTFDINVDGSVSPYHDDGRTLLRVGISGQDIALDDRREAVIAFVIDTSGSMGRDNRLELVKRSITLLVDNLRPGDRIGIVEYGSTARKLLDPTTDKEAVKAVVNSLIARGSTNAEAGLLLGYEMVDRAFEEGKINRVILVSDGVANVGETDPDVLLREIKETAQNGITLSTIGVGLDNFNDVLMERLANHGDGNYAYIDTDAEAARLFGDGLTGLLEVIASDAKIQVEFNPASVEMYRLVGYENRALTTEEFRDDSVDAGEVGAGHTVTAIYELRLTDSPEASLGTVRVRFADPDSGEVTEISSPIQLAQASRLFVETSPAFRTTLAAAMFAEILRESPFATDVQLDELIESLEATLSGSSVENAKAAELLGLMRTARSLGVTGYVPSGE